jgi:LppP/LprE lipoprotein
VTARGAASALLTLLLGLGGCATTSTPPPDLPRGGGWLDQILLPWNERGAAVPKPPPPSPQQGENLARCRPGIRGPLTPAERAVTAAGWWLYPNSTRSLGDVSVVGASSDWDGMCRAWSYQAFVFVGERFVGTLSPVLMDSRTDGAWQTAKIETPVHLSAQFLRYAREDPLCCPSRVSEVTYRIDLPMSARESPVLVPLVVDTRPLPR